MDGQTVNVEESGRDPSPGNHSYDDGGRVVWGTELLCLFQARPPYGAPPPVLVQIGVTIWRLMAMGIIRLKVITMDWNSSGDIPLQPLPQMYIVEEKEQK